MSNTETQKLDPRCQFQTNLIIRQPIIGLGSWSLLILWLDQISSRPGPRVFRTPPKASGFGWVSENPRLFQGNLRWWNIIIWPDLCSTGLKLTYIEFGMVGSFVGSVVDMIWRLHPGKLRAGTHSHGGGWFRWFYFSIGWLLGSITEHFRYLKWRYSPI